ncbi:MAG: DsrE family protein [Thermaerobacter sp.]|nr:DsrE family protein [Thermaerobacter sp.]
MKILFIVNDPPYGSERAYNAMRHANAVAKNQDVAAKIFFIADAVLCAHRGQLTPNGYYNLERMIAIAVRHGAECGACGSCMDARALTDDVLIPGVHRSSMDELSAWTLWADKVLVY